MKFAFPHDKFPSSLEEEFPSAVESIKKKYPYFLKHVGETIEELPNGEFMAGTGRYGQQDEYDRHYDNSLGKPKSRL
jgi:hypothetical protein